MERLALTTDSKVSATLSDKEFEQMLNREEGNLTGYNCPACKNRGYFYHINGNDRWITLCECDKIRKGIIRMKKSGLGKVMEDYRFDNFETDQPWKRKMLDIAQAFTESPRGWLYISGQPGVGKTHLCGAVLREFILSGCDAVYFPWLEGTREIKYTDFAKRNEKIESLQRCQILYIDDFLKVQCGTQQETRDIKMAYDILNQRYINELRTMISTEIPIDELCGIDEALGSRIFEMSKDFQIDLKRDSSRNQRLK